MSKSRYRYRDLHWNAPWPGEQGGPSRTAQVKRAVGELQKALDQRDAERKRVKDVERIKRLMAPRPGELEGRERQLHAMGFPNGSADLRRMNAAILRQGGAR